MIKIDVRELLEVLDCTPSEQNIMLAGKHGIGKSQIIKNFYETRRKMKVVAFFLGQMSDPGDLIGLMRKNEKSGQSEFLPPYWWPVNGKPIALFLDELNRARPEILQSIHELALNKTLAGRELPPGSVVVSAVNEGDEYQLTDLDPALVSRFNVYKFAPTAEDWFLWANDNDIDERVIAFLQQNPLFLDGDEVNSAKLGDSSGGLDKFPDRRGWQRVSNMIAPLKNVDDIHIKAIAGIVGVSAAMSFKKSLATTLKVTPEQLLLEFAKYKSKMKDFKLQDYIFMNEQIIYWLNGSHYKPVQKPVLLENLHSYLLHLNKTKNQEAIAHLASMLENPKFEKVTAFVLVESAEIMKALEEYIKNIAM